MPVCPSVRAVGANGLAFRLNEIDPHLPPPHAHKHTRRQDFDVSTKYLFLYTREVSCRDIFTGLRCPPLFKSLFPALRPSLEARTVGQGDATTWFPRPPSVRVSSCEAIVKTPVMPLRKWWRGSKLLGSRFQVLPRVNSQIFHSRIRRRCQHSVLSVEQESNGA